MQIGGLFALCLLVLRGEMGVSGRLAIDGTKVANIILWTLIVSRIAKLSYQGILG